MRSLLSKVAAACVCLETVASVVPDDVAHKVVIQVSTDDERTQKIALNNAVIQRPGWESKLKSLRGPGLGLMTTAGGSTAVADLALQDITQRCNNTIKKITEKKAAEIG